MIYKNSPLDVEIIGNEINTGQTGTLTCTVFDVDSTPTITWDIEHEGNFPVSSNRVSVICECLALPKLSFHGRNGSKCMDIL